MRIQGPVFHFKNVVGVSKKNVCPYCREEIAPGAVICKHCRTPLKLSKKKKARSFWVGNYMLGFYSGTAFVILLIILYYRFF